MCMHSVREGGRKDGGKTISYLHIYSESGGRIGEREDKKLFTHLLTNVHIYLSC